MVNYGRTYRELAGYMWTKSGQNKKSPRSWEDSSGAVGWRSSSFAGRIYANVLTFRFLSLVLIFRSQRLRYRRYIFYLVI